MSNLNEANEWLMVGGTSIKSARWGAVTKDDEKVPGYVEKGEIVEDPKMVVQYKYDESKGTITNEIDTWSDGTEKKQMKIVIATEHRDSPEDNGHRAIYIRGGDLKAQVIDAVKKAGAGKEGLRKGGFLAIRFLQKKRVEGRYNTFWQAMYRPPAQVEVNDFMGMEPPAAPAQQSYQAPQQSYQAPQQPQWHGEQQTQPGWSRQPETVAQQAQPGWAEAQPQVNLSAPWDVDVTAQPGQQPNMTALDMMRAQQPQASQAAPAHVNRDEFEQWGI